MNDYEQYFSVSFYVVSSNVRLAGDDSLSKAGIYTVQKISAAARFYKNAVFRLSTAHYKQGKRQGALKANSSTTPLRRRGADTLHHRQTVREDGCIFWKKKESCRKTTTPTSIFLVRYIVKTFVGNNLARV